jgi:hypothetical protein
VLTFFDEYGYDSACPVLGLVDKVHLHRKVLPVDRMLARRVKVKVLQLKLVVRYSEAAWILVLLNGVAVVDEMNS